jgi:methionine-rich copper-binding protein CopC
MAIRAVRATALGALVGVAAGRGLAAPAQAHNYLVSSTPAEGATLTELPAQFSVTTNGTLLSLDGSVNGFAMEIKDADGLYYGDGCVTVSGATMSEPAALGAAGDYTMLWQLISTDGHTVSGEVNFSWAPAAGVEASDGAAAPATCGNEAGAPVASGPQEARPNADLDDVLWIGGAIGAVLLAGLVTFLVVTRRRKA